MEVKEIVEKYRALLRIEEKTQEERWFDQSVSFKELRAQGAIIYPVKITNKSYGFSDFPTLTVSFSVSGGVNYSLYKEGMPVALFVTTSEEICNGQLLTITNHNAEILLYTSDFPDWIDDKNIGIKRLADNKSFQQMHGVLKRIGKEENKALNQFFKWIHGLVPYAEEDFLPPLSKKNSSLNESQNFAVQKSLDHRPLQIIHGPPGTGKTTTLVAIAQALRQQGKTIVASAPSNAAIDHFANQLIKNGLKVLRFGNTAKVNASVWEHTPEGILSKEEHAKSLKKLRIRAEEFRKMARQYKRNFGKEEREQRKLLHQEARALREEIQSLIDYYLHQYLEEVDVVLGTPVALSDPLLKEKSFDVAILDEAGQCIEPLAWLVMEKAGQVILAGDHLQLPPTVVSDEAQNSGLATSILEKAIDNGISADLLNVQYRMTPEIAGFSSRYFYENQLQHAASGQNGSLIFYDTAGAGFEEKKEEHSLSIYNEDELDIVNKHLLEWKEEFNDIHFISPYLAQVEKARELLTDIHISTIDSFQGQEGEVIILSLVRNNPEGKIGFLKDYRRMNVALTRAKHKLIVIGDSTTLMQDEFYKSFIEYTEEIGAYHSVFGLLYD